MKKLLTSLIIFALVACSQVVEVPEEVIEEPIDEEEEVIVYPYVSIYTGLGSMTESSKAIAVMIGNTSEARPQSGLSLADVVYEIRVEGGITRLMAIFSSQFPQKVGPIRSIRIPFVQKVNEWKIGIVHYGGASTGLGDALGLLDQSKPVIRYDGVKGINNEFFFRSSDRSAPHNAYIKLEEAVIKAPTMKLTEKLLFTDEPIVGIEQLDFDIVYESYYSINYRFDDKTLKYTRSINNEVQIDAYNDEIIQVKNVIVQSVSHRIVEDVGYVLIDFKKSGNAEYFIEGIHSSGTWEYNSETKSTEYYDESGNSVKLRPGNTWIQVALKDTEIVLN
jgi:hypothetical protein